MKFPASMVSEAGHTDPPPEPVPGLESTLLESNDPPTPEVAAGAPCVWCGHVQAEGALCDRCGMQRHRGARAHTAPAQGDDGETLVVCGECGLPTPPPRCRGCGARVSGPE